MLRYICNPCERKPTRSKPNWIEHYNTKKHKENSHKATHICLNCNSCFIFDDDSSEYKENFEEHMKRCKKNIIQQLTENNNDNNDDDDHNDNKKELMEDNKLLKIEIVKLKEKNNSLKQEIDGVESNSKKFKEEISKLKEENNKYKEENNKYKEENNKHKEENNKYKEENIQLREKIKYFYEQKKENLELKEEVRLLNDEIKKVLSDSKTEVKQVMTNSSNDIIKICGEQMNFAQTVSKDSNKITSSAMTLLGFLQKQCPNAPPLLEFTNDNYEYTFTFDKDFVCDMLYAVDNNYIGEFIGKIINEMFLKENKEDQSMFATDCVRLNYSIKEYINENKNKWTLDKGANKVKSIIINPLLNYFIKELKSHLQKENNKMMLAGTKKSDDYIDSEDDIKQIEYNNESDSDESSDQEDKSSSSDEGWRTPKKKSDSEKSNDSDKQKKENSNKKESESEDDDYMTRPIKITKQTDNIVEPLNISKSKIVSVFDNPDKIKNPHKYHKELTIKERDSIIKQSVKIMQLIKSIEDGFVTKEVLKFITKFYQLDKSYFE